MAFRRPQLTLLASKVAVALGIVLFAAGSVLVFMVPRDNVIDKAYDKPTQIPVYSAEPESDPVITHNLVPKKVTPSKSHVPASGVKTTEHVPSAHATVAGKPSPSSAASKSALNPPTVVTPTTTPKSSTSPTTTTPSATPAPPTAPSSTASGTVWYTSQTAVDAAERMKMVGRVGDPVCSLSSYGPPNPSQVPQGLKSVGVGESNGYWCLLYDR